MPIYSNLGSLFLQVLFCKMAEDQKDLYKNYIASKEIDSIIHGKHNLFVGLINLRKICNHPHLFDGGPKVIKENPKFHKQIPGVKAGVSGTSNHVIAKNGGMIDDDEEDSDLEIDPAEESFGDWKKSGKMVVVETLLRLWHNQKQKVLLFTQSRQVG
jgi:DNA excision repair protein ERCC-6